MTKQELTERQAWSLEQKIDHSVGVIEAFAARMRLENMYVSFSGGKDSTVLLDIARRFVRKDFPAVFCNTGNEWPEIVRFVRGTENVEWIKPKMTPKEVFEKHGFPLVSKEQSLYIRQARNTKSEKLREMRTVGRGGVRTKIGTVAKKWMWLVDDVKFETSEACCEKLKKAPFVPLERDGRFPLIGVMAGESKMRESMYVKRGGCNQFEGKHKASYPLSIWTDADIWAYIRKFGLEYCEIYDHGADRTGCVFCGYGAHMKGDERFLLLKSRYPKMYEQVMNYENNGVKYKQALTQVGAKIE